MKTSLAMIFGAMGLATAQMDIETRLVSAENATNEEDGFLYEDAYFGGDSYLDSEGDRRRAEVTDMVKDLIDKMPGASAKWRWKDSYGNGWGKPLQTCRKGKVQIGALCYDKCKPGYYRRKGTFDCWQHCPSGFRDDGNFCRKPEYGRGVGYALWNWNWCESDHGKGNCEQHGLIYYPKCKRGYENFGCCICRPKSFRCSDYGLGWQSDISCHKKVEHSPGLSGMICDSKHYQSGLLCYPKCKSGYTGVGPVCWTKTPPGWVNCGAFYADTKANCFHGPVHDAFKAIVTVPALVVDAMADLGKCLADHTTNIADKFCSWEDVDLGCRVNAIKNGHETTGFKLGCPVPYLALGFEYGAQKVTGGDKFVARVGFGNKLAATKAWEASPLKDHVYMFANVGWKHEDDVELQLKDGKFYLQLPGSKLDMEGVFAVYNENKRGVDDTYNPCSADESACMFKLNEGKEKLISTTIGAALGLPLLVEIEAGINLEVRPITTNIPKLELKASFRDGGVPLFKTVTLDLHSDTMEQDFMAMLDENAMQQAIMDHLDLCLVNPDAFVEDVKQRFAEEIEDAMAAPGASILTAQMEKNVKAKFDICLGLDLRVAVNGVGGEDWINVCVEASVDVTMKGDVNGIQVEHSILMEMKPIDVEVEVKVPTTLIRDTVCSVSKLAEIQLMGRCLPFMECGRQFAESTCMGVADELLAMHNTEDLDIEGIPPISFQIMGNQTLYNATETLEYPNPHSAMLKQAAALGLDPIQMVKLVNQIQEDGLEDTLLNNPTLVVTVVQNVLGGLGGRRRSNAQSPLGGGPIPTVPGLPPFFNDVIQTAADLLPLPGFDAQAQTVPTGEAVKLLEALANANYEKVVDEITAASGMDDVVKSLRCRTQKATPIPPKATPIPPKATPIPPSKRTDHCVRITTGEGKSNDGTLDVRVNGKVVASGKYAKGSTVWEECRASLPLIEVHNPSTNGWAGLVEMSTNGGETYDAAVCPSCSQGPQQIKAVHGICLDAAERSKRNGKVVMWGCNTSNKNQIWEYNRSTGQIKATHGLCLDAAQRNTKGGKVLMWSCDIRNKNQHWTYNPATGQIKATHGSKCLDASQRSKSGGRVHMWDCNTRNANQMWKINGLSSVLVVDGDDNAAHLGSIHCLDGDWCTLVPATEEADRRRAEELLAPRPRLY